MRAERPSDQLDVQYSSMMLTSDFSDVTYESIAAP